MDMPFTPFHLGPALVIGLLLFSLFDLPTLLVSSVIVDIEPFLVLLFKLDYPTHGFFHSHLGGTIMAVAVALTMFAVRKGIQRIMSTFKLQQKSSFTKISFTSLFGVYSHIFLDSPLYQEIKPFYPLDFNPMYRTISASSIYLFCILSFLAGFILYVYRIRRNR